MMLLRRDLAPAMQQFGLARSLFQSLSRASDAIISSTPRGNGKMYSRVTELTAVAASTFALAGCASYRDAAPGINRDERYVLVSHYRWSPDLGAPTYTRRQLDALLRASADVTLKGERGDAQESRLAVALAVLGDDTFAEAVAQQPQTVRSAVACYMSDLCFLSGLHYPKTKELLRAHT
jgi:hypothetical protein